MVTGFRETVSEVTRKLGVETETGLTSEEARRRLKEYGPNQLRGQKPPSPAARLLGQLKDPMILVLLAAAGLSWWAGGGRDWLDSAIILLIVLVNAVLSISQEDSAQRALEELRRMAAPTALARRDGAIVKVDAAGLTPGDIVYLAPGDQVPADGRVISGQNLRVDESAMTGESVPVEKHPAVLPPDTPLAERTNMVLAGDIVVAGKGVIVVTATGMETEMGRIAQLLGDKDDKTTPLQRKMTEISKVLSILCLAVCGAMFVLGVSRGKDLPGMFLTAVSLAVAAIPEGLPAIVTIVLALGVRRLAKEGAIVTKLPAVETLGCAGVICSDKTGTLTQNRMEARRMWSAGLNAEDAALTAFALCNDARLNADGTAEGDPTEAALLLRAKESGLDVAKLVKAHPRLGELPFDATRKRMTTFHTLDGQVTALVKGAPDLLLERCDKALTPSGEIPLTPELRHRIEKANREMGEDALRVLAAAWRRYDALPRRLDAPSVENRLTFLGLAGMMDPPRREAKEAVAACYGAGIRPVMITGDHRSTAVAVARELGILQEGQAAITGEELDFLDQKALEDTVDNIAVYARVTPEHKTRIVKAWQAKGQVVAMTGDGVNDAPALRAADIGCAMGKSGAQVAKSAAHLILTDDNFSTIVSAVAQGRGIYANIKKAIHYLLSCNIGEIITLFLATLLDFRQAPLTPAQLLWLNLVTDSLPALALGVEPVERDVMERPPRGGREPLFGKRFTLRLLWQGCMVGLLTLAAYFLGERVLSGPAGADAAANTMAFATLTLCQLFHAYNSRSETASIFELGVFSNRAMNKAFLAGLAMQLAALLLPPLRIVFSTVPMTPLQWMTVLALAVAPIAVCETVKGTSGRRKGTNQ